MVTRCPAPKTTPRRPHQQSSTLHTCRPAIQARLLQELLPHGRKAFCLLLGLARQQLALLLELGPPLCPLYLASLCLGLLAGLLLSSLAFFLLLLQRACNQSGSVEIKAWKSSIIVPPLLAAHGGRLQGMHLPPHPAEKGCAGTRMLTAPVCPQS